MLSVSRSLQSCRLLDLWDPRSLTNAVVLVVVGLQKAFIAEMFERGIPRDSSYSFVNGLQTEHGKTVNHATNVLAAEVLDGIINEIPRYGIRPPVSGYLYAAEVGK